MAVYNESNAKLKKSRNGLKDKHIKTKSRTDNNQTYYNHDKSIIHNKINKNELNNLKAELDRKEVEVRESVLDLQLLYLKMDRASAY